MNESRPNIYMTHAMTVTVSCFSVQDQFRVRQNALSKYIQCLACELQIYSTAFLDYRSYFLENMVSEPVSQTHHPVKFLKCSSPDYEKQNKILPEIFFQFCFRSSCTE